MRLPSSWDDKTLLQEPVLRDEFTVHKYFSGGARTRDQKNLWITRLSTDIYNKPELRDAAARWAEYAFAPEKASTSESAEPHSVDASDHASLASIEVFVRFYWAWFADGRGHALKIVNLERKKRGFVYHLADVPRDDRNTRHDSPVVSGTCSTREQALRSEPTRRPELRVVTQVPERTGGVVSTDSGLGLTLRESSSAEAAFVADGPRLNSTDFDIPGFCEEEDKGVVVFAGARDVETFIAKASDVDVASNCSSPLSELPPTPPNERASPTGSDVDEETLTVPVPRYQSPRKKKPRLDIAPEALRRGQPRQASKQQQLSLIAQAEFSYHARARRGLTDDLADLLPADDEREEVTASPRSRKKKSKKQFRAVSLDIDEHMTSPTDNLASATSSEPVAVDGDGASVLSMKIGTANERGSVKHPGECILKAKAKTRRSMRKKKPAATDVPARPAKRLRIEHSGVTRATIRLEAEREVPPVSGQTRRNVEPMDHSLQSVPKASRKRARGLADTSDAIGPEGLKAKRKMAKLPRRISKRIPNLANTAPHAPLPSRSTLGIPADLPEADRMLRGSATEAIMGLCNTTTTADVWVKDTDLQDDPPALSSDDERVQDHPLQSATLAYPSSEEEDTVLRRVRVGPVACDVQLSLPLHTIHDRPSAKHGTVEDSDTEEDIPLCRIVSSRGSRVVHELQWHQPGLAQTPLSTAYAMPPVKFFPATLGASSLCVAPAPIPSPFTRMPNHVGTRVPRPVLLPVSKPPLTAQPTIWAKSRQEVCESFDWFRSYQSGVYHSKEMVKGYLLSAFSASRDVFARDGRLIISHGGGKAESIHSNKGQHKVFEASDQQEGDKSVRALLCTYKMKRPVVLVIDDRYSLFPYDLSAKQDCTYVVLGFYHIAHAWAERQPANNGKGYVVRYKFAFEWCERQPAPWWIQQDMAPPSPDSHGTPPESVPRAGSMCHTCSSCSKSSPLVYEPSWMCLHPNCPAFWTRLDGTRPPEDLTYADSFLHATFECNHEMLEDLAPQPPATEAIDGVITSRRFTKGWHCKNCGRLSCRFKWQHWECQSCKSTLQVVGMNRSPKEFWDQKHADFVHHKIAADSGIQVSPLTPYRTQDQSTGHYHVYVLPENRGKIYLVLGSRLINTVADEIFEAYQEQAKTGELQFRRWPLRSHQCRGELLTNYFSQNTGEPYQYVGGTANTVPFDVAPSAVVKARDLIQSRMMSVFQAEGQPYKFNEVLSAAYMEEQRMAFHSDAEHGLGPRVASLSLGSAALMHFRLLKKHRKDNGTGTVRNALTLFLRHGDVLIMDGAEVQEYYEHTVVPLNFRIAATARYIDNRNNRNSH